MAVFALSLTAVLLAAALAFDGGLVFVERRDQQNAADAAALAGARYLTSSGTTSRTNALSAAYAIAADNGFSDGVAAATVKAYVPPISGPHSGQAGYIEVQIGSTRPSFFAGLAGIAKWDISARAVALNGDGAGGDFALLSLNKDPGNAGCDALKVTGTGSVEAHGDIQVNSPCDAGGLRAGGGGTVTVIDVDTNGYACNVVGPSPSSIIPGEADGAIDCAYNMDATPLEDPLKDLEPPARPALAQPPKQISGETEDIPDGCPGAPKKPSSWESPQLCRFANAKYEDTTWVLYPGLYPGGLDLNDATFHLMPGIYYIAGGGLSAGGEATVLTVDAGGNLHADGSAKRGVMFYNTEHPTVAWGPIQLNGGGSDFEILPLEASSLPDANYNGIVLFNDRDFPGPAKPRSTAITLNGGGSDFAARGTIYSATGLVTVNGNSAEYEMTLDQAIAWDFSLNGNGGSISALMDTDYLFKLRAAGLVE